MHHHETQGKLHLTGLVTLNNPLSDFPVCRNDAIPAALAEALALGHHRGGAAVLANIT